MKSEDEPRSKRRRQLKQWSRRFGHMLSSDEYNTLISIRRLVGGSVQYFNETSNMKMGAASFEELSAWPDIMIMDFMRMPFGRARLASLRNVCEWGLVMHSDCSGKMTPEAVLQVLDIALRRQGFVLPDDWIALWRACDSAVSCQDFLRGASNRPMHLFVDLMGRQPPVDQVHLKHLRPLPGATPNQRELAHRAQVAHLEENKIKLSQAFTARNCLFHPALTLICDFES